MDSPDSPDSAESPKLCEGALLRDFFLFNISNVMVSQLSPDEKVCHICYTNYAVDANGRACGPDYPVSLPCGHLFGHQCLSSWVSAAVRVSDGQVTCPLCRAHCVTLPRSTNVSAYLNGGLPICEHSTNCSDIEAFLYATMVVYADMMSMCFKATFRFTGPSEAVLDGIRAKLFDALRVRDGLEVQVSDICFDIHLACVRDTDLYSQIPSRLLVSFRHEVARFFSRWSAPSDRIDEFAAVRLKRSNSM